jgi:hypothetical protein
VAEGVAEHAAPNGGPDPARRWVEELLAFARTPEGAAALEAEREAARADDGGAPEPEAGGAGVADPAPEAADEDEEEPVEGDDQAEDGDDEGDDDDADGPEGQDPAQDPTRVVGPAPGPAPPRTVWEAFAWLDQEGGEDEGDDDAA